MFYQVICSNEYDNLVVMYIGKKIIKCKTKSIISQKNYDILEDSIKNNNRYQISIRSRKINHIILRSVKIVKTGKRRK